jgi:hypothetical protein
MRGLLPSRYSSGLRHELSSLARTLWSWVRIPLRACMFDMYMWLFCVCALRCLGRGLATSWSLVQGVLPIVNSSGDWKAAKVHKGCRAIKKKIGVCVTNNNGFWIGLLDSLALPLQLQPIITAHNQWLSKTRSIPYRTTSVFSSTVTDLVPIYESVTSSASSASVIRWLALHNWTLNFWILLRLKELTNVLSFTSITRGEQKTAHYLQQFVCYCVYSLPRERVYRTVAQQWVISRLFVAAGTC